MQDKNKPLYICYLIFLLLLNACSQEEKTPKGILNKSEMKEVMIDIHLADAALNLSNYGPSNYPTDKKGLYETVYLKHKITKKKFEDSFAYYTDHPEVFEKLYADIIEGLSRKQAELAKKNQ